MEFSSDSHDEVPLDGIVVRGELSRVELAAPTDANDS